MKTDRSSVAAAGRIDDRRVITDAAHRSRCGAATGGPFAPAAERCALMYGRIDRSAATFECEFSGVTSSYAGKDVLLYVWLPAGGRSCRKTQ
jgi:hypothetical protein